MNVNENEQKTAISVEFSLAVERGPKNTLESK